MDLRKTFADNLRRLRYAKGLSQAGVAHEAGITRPYLNKLETGTFNASLDTIAKLAAALGVRPAKLLELQAKQRKRRA
jgi:transcriptional regulator with XRE-family HTH domain